MNRVFNLNLNNILLIIILVLAIIVRFYKLESFPPSLSWDEISHGYNAYSILETGRDEWGEFLPISNFRAYGDYPLPLYMYLSIPTIAIFGLDEFTIRSTSAIFGVLLVVVVYFLSKLFIEDKKAILLTVLIAAISPWTIMISRQVLQATPAIFFLGLGMVLLMKYFKKNLWFFNLGLVSLGISAYGYHNTRILAPILLFILLLFWLKDIWQLKRYFISLMIWGVIFFAPIPFIILSPEGSARSQFVGIIDQGAINQINESRGNSNLPDFAKRLTYNKVTYFSKVSIRNYLGYFSPLFLGFQGGTQYQYSVPSTGVLYPVTVIFFYIGVIYLIYKTKLKNYKYKFLLIWFLLSPLPAAVTRDPYQVIRGTTMLPALFIVIGLGLEKSLFLISRYSSRLSNLFITTFVVLLTFSFVFYTYVFLNTYNTDYSFAWQYGYKQAVKFAVHNQDKYQKIIFTKKYGEPHEFVLFYQKYDPTAYQFDKSAKKYYQNGWYSVDNFGKYQFIDDEKIQSQTADLMNTLIITSPGNYPKKAHLIKTIYFLNGVPAFDIVEL